MMFRLTAFAAAAWLILRWDQRRRASAQQPQAKPVEVTTWEGEGGALPTVGPQHGPAPTTTPS
jgi:hypothetical protein